MFRYHVNPGSLNSGVKEKIKIGKIPNFFLVLDKKLANYRIIIVGIIIREIIKRYSCLKKQRFVKHFLRKVQRVSGQELRNIENSI